MVCWYTALVGVCMSDIYLDIVSYLNGIFFFNFLCVRHSTATYGSEVHISRFVLQPRIPTRLETARQNSGAYSNEILRDLREIIHAPLFNVLDYQELYNKVMFLGQNISELTDEERGQYLLHTKGVALTSVHKCERSRQPRLLAEQA